MSIPKRRNIKTDRRWTVGCKAPGEVGLDVWGATNANVTQDSPKQTLSRGDWTYETSPNGGVRVR